LVLLDHVPRIKVVLEAPIHLLKGLGVHGPAQVSKPVCVPSIMIRRPTHGHSIGRQHRMVLEGGHKGAIWSLGSSGRVVFPNERLIWSPVCY
jgi:hypothetical protein